MKQCFLLLSFLLGILLPPCAQNIVLKTTPRQPESEWIFENPVANPEPFTAVFAVLFAQKPLTLRYAEAKADGVYSAWKDFPEDRHLKEGSPENRQVHGLVFLEKEIRFLKIALMPENTDAYPEGDLSLYFFNPNQKTEMPGVKNHATVHEREACDCALPAHKKRADWCTTGNCNPSSPPTQTTVTHLVVHHSAGVNTAANWDAVVTSIYNLHVTANGWADIGYNWLIAPDGALFQGRDDNVTGAHFCGVNANTMGVCMLGTYVNQTITAAAQLTLTRLLAWKCCVRNLNPKASSLHFSSNLVLPRICGHRDGCATECPGEFFYQTLSALRDSVALSLNQCTQSGVEDAASQAVEVFPNPVTDGEIQVRLNDWPGENIFFSIFNAEGKPVQTTALAPDTQTLRLDLENGLYFWKCAIGNTLRTGKFVMLRTP